METIMSAQPNSGMQPTTFENPMGVDGFEFVEFAAPDPKLLHDLFKRLKARCACCGYCAA